MADPVTAEILDATRRMDHRDLMVFLDYDGTLTQIMPKPSLATPDGDLKSLLAEFAGKFTTVIVTGRTLEDIRDFLGDAYSCIALHGSLYYHDGSIEDLSGRIQEYSRITSTIFGSCKFLEKRFPGMVMYDKHGGVLFHHTAMNPALIPDLQQEIQGLAREYGMSFYRGKNVMEVRIPGIDKGTAIRKVRNGHPAMIAGDDATDEEAFVANPEAITIHVGNNESSARYSIPDYRAMRNLMRLMIDDI